MANFDAIAPRIACALILSLAGCNEAPTAPAPSTGQPPTHKPATVSRFLQPLDHAQPKLRTVVLELGGLKLETEVCSEPVEILTGMMYREKMEDTEGMIFVLPGCPRRASFYMRNTKVPLSCAYIDSAGRILEIHDLRPLDETPVESATEQICYVLEVPQGWFQRKKIAVGEFIRTSKGSLPEALPLPR